MIVKKLCVTPFRLTMELKQICRLRLVPEIFDVHMLDKLFRNVVPEFPYLSRQRLVFSIAKRLSTIQHFCIYINHHIPPHLVSMETILGVFFYLHNGISKISEMFPSQDIHIYVPIPANLRFFVFTL